MSLQNVEDIDDKKDFLSNTVNNSPKDGTYVFGNGDVNNVCTLTENNSPMINYHLSHTPEWSGDTPRHFMNLPTPMLTPTHNYCISSPTWSDSNFETYQNPEPPSELTEELREADTIGGTVFSKHWVFTVLMEVIKVVDESITEIESRLSSSINENIDSAYNIDEPLQDALCRLWDMSINTEVVEFLMKFQAVDILISVINKSQIPRVTEICVGILANMTCDKTLLSDKTINNKLIQSSLLVLSDTDPPTLVEVMRLMNTCCSNHELNKEWFSTLQKDDCVYEKIIFILKSSTNENLLEHTVKFLDTIMYFCPQICQSWCTLDLVSALFESLKQIGGSSTEMIDSVIHIFQLFSTNDTGASQLVHHTEGITELLFDYLRDFIACENILIFNGFENSLSSIFSIFETLVCSDGGTTLLFEDHRLIKYLLKILEVVQRKLEQDMNNKNSNEAITKSSDLTTQSSLRSPKDNLEPTICDEEIILCNKKNASRKFLTYSPLLKIDKVDKDASFSENPLQFLHTVLKNLLKEIIQVSMPHCNDIKMSEKDVEYVDVDHKQYHTNQDSLKNKLAMEDRIPCPAFLKYLNNEISVKKIYCMIDVLESFIIENTFSNFKEQVNIFQLCRLKEILIDEYDEIDEIDSPI